MTEPIWLHEAFSLEGRRFRIGREGTTWIAEWQNLVVVHAPAHGQPRIDVLDDSLASAKLRAGPVVGLLGHLTGDLHWHGAACAWDGLPSVLVLGPSGTGKSTLVAGLGTVGAAFLADDVARLEPIAGTWHVRRVDDFHALRADVVPMLYASTAVNKALFAPERPASNAPLGLILALEVGPELRLRELGPRASMQLLQQNMIRLALDDSSRLLRDLDVVLEILQTTPVYALVRPPTFQDWPALHRLLTTWLRGALRDIRP